VHTSAGGRASSVWSRALCVWTGAASAKACGSPRAAGAADRCRCTDLQPACQLLTPEEPGVCRRLCGCGARCRDQGCGLAGVGGASAQAGGAAWPASAADRRADAPRGGPGRQRLSRRDHADSGGRCGVRDPAAAHRGVLCGAQPTGRACRVGASRQSSLRRPRRGACGRQGVAPALAELSLPSSAQPPLYTPRLPARRPAVHAR